MAAPKVLSGARAKLGIMSGDKVDFVGIFNNVSYGMTLDAQPAYILGRYGPAEIDYTAMEPVRISCTGWRVVHHGAHVDAKIPNLKDLLTHEYLTLVIVDRQTNAAIATFRQVRPVSYDTTINARNLNEITCTFMGILVDDEDTENAETANAADLP
jgi:hypothetical protein